jgi:hypothetical protein
MIRRLLQCAFWAWFILLSGCTVYQNARRTLVYEPAEFSWKHDRRRSVNAYRELAERLWQQEALHCPELSVLPDYAIGFRDGFVDYVYAGGTGEPPPIPPRHFWNVALRAPDGKQRTDQWFAGYRHGAQVARDGGYRELGTIDSSVLGIAADSLAGYVHDVGAPAHSSPEESWPDAEFEPHMEVLPEPADAPTVSPPHVPLDAPVDGTNQLEGDSGVAPSVQTEDELALGWTYHAPTEEPVRRDAISAQVRPALAVPSDSEHSDNGPAENVDVRENSETASIGDAAVPVDSIPGNEPMQFNSAAANAAPVLDPASTHDSIVWTASGSANPQPADKTKKSTLRIMVKSQGTRSRDEMRSNEPAAIIRTSFTVEAPAAAKSSPATGDDATDEAPSPKLKSTIRIRNNAGHLDKRLSPESSAASRQTSFIR